MYEELGKTLKQARVEMLLHSPFFASVVMSLPLVENEELPAAMGTDGLSIMYNPKMLQTLTKDQIKTIFAHEAMHVTNLHHLRMGNRTAMVVTCGNPYCAEKGCKRQQDVCVNGGYVEEQYSLWNVSTDYSINGLLKEAGFNFDWGGLVDDELGRNSGEKNYDILYKKMEKSKNPNGSGNGKGKGKGDILVPAPNQRGDVSEPKKANGQKLTEAEKKLVEAKTKDLIKNAADAARRQGKLPAGIDRYVKELFQPKVNWKEAIAQFVSKYSRNDYNWSRRSKRYTKFYLPSLKSPEVGKIVVGIDTSGSLSERDLTDIASEITGIVSTYQGIELTVIYCDSEVNKVEEFTENDMIKLKMVGGGGTDYRPVFKYIKDRLDEQPVALLYFTDGYCDGFPKEVPDYPVMWILTYKNDGFRNKFGDVVNIHHKQGEEDY